MLVMVTCWSPNPFHTTLLSSVCAYRVRECVLVRPEGIKPWMREYKRVRLEAVVEDAVLLTSLGLV